MSAEDMRRIMRLVESANTMLPMGDAMSESTSPVRGNPNYSKVLGGLSALKDRGVSLDDIEEMLTSFTTNTLAGGLEHNMKAGPISNFLYSDDEALNNFADEIGFNFEDLCREVVGVEIDRNEADAGAMEIVDLLMHDLQQ